MDGLALIVEIHDVSPLTLGAVREIHDALEGIGIRQPGLLVIPAHENEHGRRYRLAEHPGTVSWLVSMKKAGSEIIQHGLTHRAPGPPPPGFTNWLMHHHFSRGLAEFAHLSRTQAAERLVAGRAILGECGLSPAGFIAPAWLQSEEALAEVERQEYGFTAFLNKVIFLGDKREVENTWALTWDAPGPAVDYPKRLAMRGIEWFSRSARLLRVAIHPADTRGARPLDAILRRLGVLMRSRRLTRYTEWSS
jgi:predicted deacetylase